MKASEILKEAEDYDVLVSGALDKALEFNDSYRVVMFKSAGGGWVARCEADGFMHRVQGQKAKVATWALSAAIDGPGSDGPCYEREKKS